jgi:hypothetical protein
LGHRSPAFEKVEPVLLPEGLPDQRSSIVQELDANMPDSSSAVAPATAFSRVLTTAEAWMVAVIAIRNRVSELLMIL